MTRLHSFFALFIVIAVLVTLFLTPFQPTAAAQDNLCADTFKTVAIPLTDLGSSEYVRLEGESTGFFGGLYPDGENGRPPEHAAAGMALARQIQPLNADGEPDTEGLIGMISIGMSNTSLEFRRFEEMVAVDASLNPHLSIVNGAQASKVAQDWVDPNAGTWEFLNARLHRRKVSPEQVQIAWVKQVNTGPGQFPDKQEKLETDLTAIVHNLHAHYPNIKLVYLSSRTRAYTYWHGLSPEPMAYESGFAVKWLIEKQINGDPALNFDPNKGAVTAPYLSWGPYLWADGENARSDGFVWLAEDMRRDCTHPSEAGTDKIAMMLMDFFKSDETAVSWFLAPSATEDSPGHTLRQLRRALEENGRAHQRPQN